MTAPAPPPVRIPAERLVSFCAAVLEAVGVAPDHATTTGRRLVEADLRGRTGHGLIRIGPYVERIEAGGVNLRPDIRVLHETPVSAQLDADNGLGQVAMTMATDLAVAKARETGLAWMGTVHSNHAGAGGVYASLAARQGLVAVYLAVANANAMPPWGGTERLLGTNPIAIGVPAGDRPPFVLDIATTVVSHGTLKVAAMAGEEIPAGWVVDADGRPITDPARAGAGFLMPIGGYKGAGLTIAIGLLAGVLNGAAFGGSVVDHAVDLATPTNTGQALLVMRPDLFLPADAVAASIVGHLDELRRSGSSSGEPLRLPGDRAAELEVENAARGIPVPGPLRARLSALAERLGVTEDLEGGDA
ncbi:MAG TPA: Ldh family oxidoreductase [Acidimicrobiales bacterium]|nr:Ldh family oxidoreductase [Acidimicrobiales bacterium]